MYTEDKQLAPSYKLSKWLCQLFTYCYSSSHLSLLYSELKLWIPLVSGFSQAWLIAGIRRRLQSRRKGEGTSSLLLPVPVSVTLTVAQVLATHLGHSRVTHCVPLEVPVVVRWYPSSRSEHQLSALVPLPFCPPSPRSGGASCIYYPWVTSVFPFFSSSHHTNSLY
jgi:hypothetical protein